MLGQLSATVFKRSRSSWVSFLEVLGRAWLAFPGQSVSFLKEAGPAFWYVLGRAWLAFPGRSLSFLEEDGLAFWEVLESAWLVSGSFS
jgi:hypothetical protein